MVYETVYIHDTQPFWRWRLLSGRCSPDGTLLRVIHEQRRRVCYYLDSSISITGYYDHRMDGPAMINYNSGYIRFIVRNRYHYNTLAYCQDVGMSDEDTFMWLLRFGDELPTTCEEYYGEGWKDMALEEF